MAMAAFYGLVSGSTLFIGALIGIYLNIPTRLLGAILAFSSGVMISSLTFDLMENAFLSGGFASVSIGFLSGTLLFVLGDYLIDRADAYFRRDSEQAPDPLRQTGTLRRNSGSTVLLGFVLDGIPESLAIGIGLAAEESIGLSMMIAVLLSNLPEGISGAIDMKNSGRSNFYILSIWGVTIFAAILAAAAGYGLLGGASPHVIAINLSIAAGAILAMLSNKELPEAFEISGRFTAIVTALGFFITFCIIHLAD
jgi:ZIP family zinc transporter